MSSPTIEERRVLGQIEPYVLMAASTLITCAFNRNYAPFDLMCRPHVFRATASAGRVEFEVPDWLPIAEALVAVGQSGVHSMVKHLQAQRAESPSGSGLRVHRFQFPPAVCGDGESVSLIYSPWFRFAAPPYRFDVDSRASAYVVTALRHLCQAHGMSVQASFHADSSLLRFSDRLCVEVMGDSALTDIIVQLDDEESHLGLQSPQLSVSRPMFPDVYAAALQARKNGEHFEGASLTLEEDRLMLSVDTGAADVPA